MTESEIAYDTGFVDGLRAYAHWKDGQQFVGTCGRTLAEALIDREEAWGYSARYRAERIQQEKHEN